MPKTILQLVEDNFENYVKQVLILVQLCSSLIPECAVSHVTSLPGILMYNTWKPKENYDMCASAFVVQFKGFMSLKIYFMLNTDINIRETTYSRQF